MKRGLYRNTVGAELRVLEPVMAVGRFRSLGGIYRAEPGDRIFMEPDFLVTQSAMDAAGYELVEEAAHATEGGDRG